MSGTTVRPTKAELLRGMADAHETIAKLTRELAALEADVGGDDYSSRNLPPDMRSRDRFRRVAKRIPEARRVGQTWTVPRDAWRRFRTSRTGEHAKPAPVLPAYDDLLTPAEALAAAGSRRIVRPN